jgi:hypothetical protein
MPLVTLENDSKTKYLAYYESTSYDNLFHVCIVRFHNICLNLCMIFKTPNFHTKITLVGVPKVLMMFGMSHLVNGYPTIRPRSFRPRSFRPTQCIMIHANSEDSQSDEFLFFLHN